jgi:transcriptional regulator with XRE-family HTH domain
VRQSLKSNPSGPKTFGQAIRRLRLERGLSMEELAYRTRDNDADRSRRGLSFSYISLIERDYRRATPEVIELLAQTLDVSPREFAEYRLALARRLFDEEAVGVEDALANFDLLTKLVASYKGTVSDGTQAVSRFEKALSQE